MSGKEIDWWMLTLETRSGAGGGEARLPLLDDSILTFFGFRSDSTSFLEG